MEVIHRARGRACHAHEIAPERQESDSFAIGINEAQNLNISAYCVHNILEIIREVRAVQVRVLTLQRVPRLPVRYGQIAELV